MKLLIVRSVLALVPSLAVAEIRKNPGSTTAPPHDEYIHVVSEADSPVQQTYIGTKDGLYVAAAIRKPKGNGPFPAIIIFHGAPGGRGMEQITGWFSRRHGRGSVSGFSRRASSWSSATTAAATGTRYPLRPTHTSRRSTMACR